MPSARFDAEPTLPPLFMPGRAEFATEFAAAEKRAGSAATAGGFTMVVGGGVLRILPMLPVWLGAVPGFTDIGLEGGL